VSGGFIEKLAGPLKATPYRIAITGHTSASKTPSRAEYGPWNLSADRANVPPDSRSGGHAFGQLLRRCRQADTDPLFPDDPFIAANRRVTITLMREAPGPAGSQALGGVAALAPRRRRRQLTALAGLTRRHRPLAIAGVNAFALQNS
jgi:hypothetical protein